MTRYMFLLPEVEVMHCDRLDPSKAEALGVPRGEMMAALKAGKSVTVTDGRVVR